MLLVGWVLRFVLHAPYTTIGGDGARLQKGEGARAAKKRKAEAAKK